MQESQLIKLLKKRDRAGFEYMYNRYADALYGYIFRITDEEAASEQLLKESFVKIWRDCAAFNLPQQNLFSCMIRVTNELVINYALKKGVSRTEIRQRIITANGPATWQQPTVSL